MKNIRSKLLWVASAVAAIGFFAAGAHADHPAGAHELLAQSSPDCYAIGQRVAAEQGGTLAGATAETTGSGTVCKIVVLVPGGDGERPRRQEFTVPAQ